MSGSSTVLEDDSLLSRLDRLFFKLESLLNLIGGLVIFLIVLLAVANILGRKLFDTPVSGYIDWTEQAMAFFAFFGIAYCQRLGGHIRMDIFVGSMRGRALWFFELISTLLMFCITILLVIGSYDHFLRAWTNGDSSFDIDLPTWPAKLVVPVMLSILSLRLFLNIWGYLRAFIVGGDAPVAVPLIEDAATQAANEAKTVSGAEVDGESK
ncbi:MAG: TRAP transporter small permease subunit [Cellvibrionaceae bacterium]